MKKVTTLIATIVLLFVIACGGGESAPKDPNDPNDPNDPKDPKDPEDPNDPNGKPSAADCDVFAEQAAVAWGMCGTTPSQQQTEALAAVCKRGAKDAELCGGNMDEAVECFMSENAAESYDCFAGQAVENCNGNSQAIIATYCIVSMGDPECASGIECTYNADCPGSSKCNSTTGQCFKETASCIGLPCTYNADCPAGQKCNSAEGACMKE